MWALLNVLRGKSGSHTPPFNCKDIYETAGDAAVMANLGRFNNLFTDHESANRIGGRTPDWEIDFKGLCWFMNSYGLQAYEEQPSDDICGVDAVQVMTIHQAEVLSGQLCFFFQP